MAIALTCARNLFSHMQHALTTKIKTRVALHKGIHQALDDFRWLLQDIQSCPTRIAELVPLLSSAEGHHDTSRKCDGGIWLPSAYIALCEGFSIQPLVWRPQWPKHIINQMITDTNPGGTISYSVFDLASGTLHLEAMAQSFDIQECTALSKTDNRNTLFW